MNMRFIFYILIIFASNLITLNCIKDAPFDNPYDPRSGSVTRGGLVRGTVTKYYDLDAPLDSVQLILTPPGYLYMTGRDGKFEINNIAPGEYQLFCSKKGFASDSTSFTFVNEAVEYNFRLNAIPEISEVILTTHHVSRWWPVEDRYFLELNVTVDDQDGINEIDSAWMRIDDFNYSRVLLKGENLNQYGVILLDYQLPLNSIHILQGKNFDVFCSDIFGNKSLPGRQYITRIVDVVPRTIDPSNQEVINTSPIIFTWSPEFLPFPITYKLEIYQVNFGLYNKVFETSNIDGSASEFKFEGSLETGDYFWLIYIVDSSGNTSSSKEATFRVE